MREDPQCCRVFLSYAREDASALQRLEAHLAPLVREQKVSILFDEAIDPGADWGTEIRSYVDSADIFVAMISADFLNSDYCLGVEVARALERQHRGEMTIWPVLLDHCDWQSSQFASMQVLPRGSDPITAFDNPNEAWSEIAQALRAWVNRSRAEDEASPQGAETSHEPTWPTADIGQQVLAEQLAAAVERREELACQGRATAGLDKCIRGLERRIRRGPALRPGEFLGDQRFRLVRRIGKGGFASVWKAFDRQRGDLVALKVLHGHLAQDSTDVSAFFAGAKRMIDAAHSNVPRILEPSREDGGRLYYVMELIDGCSLREFIDGSSERTKAGLRCIERIAEAVSHAHKQGIVHRDIRPANIIVARDGEPYLTDFDLAVFSGESLLTGYPTVGSITYTAPEAGREDLAADHTADIYSLGMTLLFVLKGEELKFEAMRDPVAEVDDLGAPEHLRRTVIVATAARPEDRFETVEAFLSALRGEQDEATLAQRYAAVLREPGLGRSERGYQDLLEQAGLAHYQLGADGRFIAASRSFKQLIGVADDSDLTKRSPRDFGFDSPFETETYRRRLAEEGAITIDNAVLERRDGSTLDYEEVGRIVRNARGVTLHYVGSIRETNGNARVPSALQRAQKMEALGHLAGGIAHDFNNLLSVILASSELALVSLDSDHEALEEVYRIMEAANQAATLTKQLVTFGRRTPTARKPTDLNRLITGISRVFGRVLGPDIAVDLRLAKSLPPVSIEASSFEQVLMNLILNAREAMPRGGQVTIATSSVAGPLIDGQRGPRMRRVVLEVSDDGVGMSPETKAQIFEPFFTTKGANGTGLGLSIVYGIVKQHGGTIAVQSAPGQGSTVHVELEAADTLEAETTETIETPTSPAMDLAEAVILLVDDEPLVRRVLERKLRSTGCTCIVASTSVEAVGLLEDQTQRIDLLVADLASSGLSGLELLRWARYLRPGLPAILTGGHVDDDAAQEIEQADRARIFLKPFQLDELVEAAANLLRGELEHEP